MEDTDYFRVCMRWTVWIASLVFVFGFGAIAHCGLWGSIGRMIVYAAIIAIWSFLAAFVVAGLICFVLARLNPPHTRRQPFRVLQVNALLITLVIAGVGLLAGLLYGIHTPECI